jgi:hypothetical protein
MKTIISIEHLISDEMKKPPNSFELGGFLSILFISAHNNRSADAAGLFALHNLHCKT